MFLPSPQFLRSQKEENFNGGTSSSCCVFCSLLVEVQIYKKNIPFFLLQRKAVDYNLDK